VVPVGRHPFRVAADGLAGAFLCLREQLKRMVARGYGAIVNMASNAGVKNAPSPACRS
jgi:NAD(P)-dependent dehydrogenase (short-subunit alcohol dehydrogenase family)